MRKRFELVDSMPPVYSAVRRAVELPLGELKKLSEKGRLSAEERESVPLLLAKIGSAAFRMVSAEVERTPPNKFKYVFRHPAPQLDFDPVAPKAIARCAANAIAQTMLFSELGGNRVGILSLPGHVVPTVKIGGTTYVLERHLFESGVPTLRDYMQELNAAYLSPEHPMHTISRALYSGETPTPGVFARKVRYFGGKEAALGSAYLNMSVYALSISNNRARAKRLFAEAIRLNPNISRHAATMGFELSP